MTKVWVAIAVSLWVAACGDAHPESVPTLGAAGQGATGRPLTADEEAWAAESDFEIALETTRCYGSCPVFDLRLRSTGEVRFTGEDFVWRPGTYEKQISAKKVVQLYQDIVRSGFLGFRDSYASPQDGCSLIDDYPSSTVRLRAAEGEKQIHFNESCSGDFPAPPVLTALKEQIMATAKIAAWLKSDQTGCGFRFQRNQRFARSYVVRDSGEQALGLLRIVDDIDPKQSSWTVLSCDAEELARGDSIGSWQCGRTLVPPHDTTMRWPGMDEPQSAVSIAPESKESPQNRPAERLVLTLFTATDEQTQDAVVGDSCSL